MIFENPEFTPCLGPSLGAVRVPSTSGSKLSPVIWLCSLKISPIWLWGFQKCYKGGENYQTGKQVELNSFPIRKIQKLTYNTHRLTALKVKPKSVFCNLFNLSLKFYVPLAVMQTQNSKGCQIFGGHIKNLHMQNFLILPFDHHVKFCVDTIRDVTQPAKIRIRWMRISYEKSVGCGWGFVALSQFVSTSYYSYCDST